MSAITGIGDSGTIMRSASTSLSRGTATRTRSGPASATSRICCMVASRLAVSVLVIAWTATGAPPPIGTSLTQIWRFEAMVRGYRGRPRRRAPLGDAGEPPRAAREPFQGRGGITRAMRDVGAESAGGRRLRRPLVGAAILCFALLVPATALASNHLVKLREVYAGDSSHTGDEYVEVQMYATGENFMANAVHLKLYNVAGGVTQDFVPTTNPPNGQNQQRVLFATSTAQTTFSKTAGYTLPPGDHIDDAGGAVCYVSATPGFADCVSWGAFNNTSGTPLPSSTGGNLDSSGIPNGQAIRRSIAGGCATLLEGR